MNKTNKLYVSGYVGCRHEEKPVTIDEAMTKRIKRDVSYRVNEVMFDDLYEALHNCDFLDELDSVKDFYEYLIVQPEFKRNYLKNIAIKAEDMIPYYEEGCYNDYFKGYDYTCFIDIDLRPFYEKYEQRNQTNTE